MAIISFQTTFNQALNTKVITFTDTTDWAGQGIPLADVLMNFSITSPSGIVIYNNTTFTTAGSDIWIANSLSSQQAINIPLGADGLPQAGNYTITATVYDFGTTSYYTQTNVVNYQHVSPKICIHQRIDCITPLFSSVDATDYTVNGIVPAISGTHTLDYPFGSAGEGAPTIVPFTASGSVIAVSVFYQGTQTTEIIAGLTYTIVSGVNAFIIIDSVSGSKEVKVDCAYICSILCCIRTFDRIKEGYKGSDSIKFKQYDDIFQEIMSYVGLMQFSINCGLGDEVCDYLQKIKTLSNCSDACKCSSDVAARVIGLGYLVGPAGPAGPTGAQGPTGNSGNYITITGEPAGVNCATGGMKVILYSGLTNLPISTNYICNGAAGAVGAPGVNGTNAFKAVKEFITDEIEQTFTITYLEKTSCSAFPGGCMIDAIDPNFFVDQVIQVWLLNSGNWFQLVQSGFNGGIVGPPATGDYTLNVDAITGLITINTGNTLGTYRVIIIA